MAGLGWQEVVIVAVIFGVVLLPLGSLIYLFRDGVRAATCEDSPSGVAGGEDCPIWRRPLWLVVVLTLVTSGSYLLVWFGVSWAELKRLARNQGMSPVGHALSLLIPILGLYRVHAHFRMLDALCASRGLAAGIRPVAAVAAMAAVTVFALAGLVGVTTGILGWVATGITAVVVAFGQRGLNRLWSSEFGSEAKLRISTAEWVVLVVWGIGMLVGIALTLRRTLA